MRIITHNMLRCNVRGAKNGYPLKIEHEKIDIMPCEYNKDMVTKLVSKCQLPALRSASMDLNISNCLTSEEEITIESIINSEQSLNDLHHLLFEVHVIDGYLVCPETGRKFPIKDSIPNMLLHEDEL